MPQFLPRRVASNSFFAILVFVLAFLQIPEISGQNNVGRRFVRTYDVQHYIIRTKFDVRRKTVDGQVTISLKPLANGFRTFELDAEGMKIESVVTASGARLTSYQQNARLRISLDRPYASSETIAFTITYRTRPRRGLYFISARAEGGYVRPAQIWTQGEPEENHFWFPCYDFPDDKATSEQYITAPAGQIAIANGKLVESAANPDGTTTYHWSMEHPHSSYLTSMVVGDFVKLSDSYESIPVDYFTYRGTQAKATRAFGKTPQMMAWFSRRLDFPFPYSRYSQTIVANFDFGGMENITATTYADSEILAVADEGPDPITENLVSHELAHSWFGNLVTCHDWSELWLNEGFATFLEAAYREQADGRDVYLTLLQDDAREYFGEDSSRKRHPLVNPRYPLSMDLFDETTYKKGAYVVHMLRQIVGDEVFWRALNIYLNRFKYDVVSSRDLQHVFEEVSSKRLDWFFDQWVYRAGYPELKVRSSYDPANRLLNLTVAQTHKPHPTTPEVFRLPVEIEIETATGVLTKTVEIKSKTETYSFHLDGNPRLVVFDKNAGILKRLDIAHPRSTVAYQMIDGADINAYRKATQHRAKATPDQSGWVNHLTTPRYDASLFALNSIR
jgi:aminopeptidase N